MTALEHALALCRAECKPVADPIAWALERVAQRADDPALDPDDAVWQAIGEHHTAACVGRAVRLVAESNACSVYTL
jgi:hypothetical protein